ncbi:unnamed protein product [Brassica rapa subsp. narinosa]
MDNRKGHKLKLTGHSKQARGKILQKYTSLAIEPTSKDGSTVLGVMLDMQYIHKPNQSAVYNYSIHLLLASYPLDYIYTTRKIAYTAREFRGLEKITNKMWER